MGKTRERLVFYSPNMVNLCLDFYSLESQCGRLYHHYQSGAAKFSSMIEALKKMERLYDYIQFPQASTICRSFQMDRKTQEKRAGERNRMPGTGRREAGSMEAFESVMGHRGKRATFVISVKFRQHSSWQGEVTWVDAGKRENFRSALELMRLLDSALCADEIDSEIQGERI